MEISEFFPFWKKLTPQEQQLLEESTAVRTYEKGEIIHDGSRDCTGLLLLTEGQMRAYTVTEEGRVLQHSVAMSFCVHSSPRACLAAR